MTIAGPPSQPVATPEAVAAVAAGRPVEAVWENQLGGLTFRIGTPATSYVKWQPTDPAADPAVDLAREADRLAWVAPFADVPAVESTGSDEHGAWLVTAAIDAGSAVDEVWKADPAPAVRAIGVGLRAFHERVPVADCPFSWSVDDRLGRDGADVGSPPPVDRSVVCHGDACAPNTLVGPDGRFVAHVDLGSLGVADRWADLAVASWSLEWNFGDGWDDVFFDAYGIRPDAERIAFYRRLWAAT